MPTTSRSLLSVLTAWTLFVAIARAESPAGSNKVAAADGFEDVAAALHAAVRYEVEAKELPAFSIALVAGDQVIWAEGFGFQDTARRRPATARTVYRVGSISKLFTDMAVMQLVEQGQIDLDAPVNEYLPEFAPQNPFGDAPVALQYLGTRGIPFTRHAGNGEVFTGGIGSQGTQFDALGHFGFLDAPWFARSL